MFPDKSRMAAAIVKKIAPAAETEEQDDGEKTEAGTPEGRLAAAEDIMDVLSGYSSPTPSDSASKVEKATAEAARRAKAKMLDAALSAWFDQYDGE